MNECEITRDLIPGYADEVLSPSGRSDNWARVIFYRAKAKIIDKLNDT